MILSVVGLVSFLIEGRWNRLVVGLSVMLVVLTLLLAIWKAGR